MVISARRHVAAYGRAPHNQEDHREEGWIATAQRSCCCIERYARATVVARLSSVHAGGPGPHSSPPYYLRTKGRHTGGAVPPYAKSRARAAVCRAWKSLRAPSRVVCRVSQPAEVSLRSVDFRSRCTGTYIIGLTVHNRTLVALISKTTRSTVHSDLRVCAATAKGRLCVFAPYAGTRSTRHLSRIF